MTRHYTQKEENQLANEMGFKPIADPNRGSGWCYFERNNRAVWKTATGWQIARIENGKHVDHYFRRIPNNEDQPTKGFYDLKDALKWVVKNQK